MMNEPLLHQEQQPLSVPSTLLVNLYIGHFLARWGARMWEFSVGLYMISIWPESLLLAAAYGVVESASTALLGPLVGQWVNNSSYIQVLRIWLLSQNLSFMVAGGGVVAIFVYPVNRTVFTFLVVLINISGAVGVLSTLAGTILVEREWVVVISEGQPPGVLIKMNTTIRRIDLSCKLFAPVISGLIVSFVSLMASAMTLALWNVLSVCLQYWLLMSVYNNIPQLKETNNRRASSRSPIDERQVLIRSETSEQTMTERFSSLPYISAWRLYLKQDVLLPGLALALLYFTILSFGTLMTATLQWQGIPAYVIGIARGISATVGIAATFLYPVLQSRVSTLRTGLWSIWNQWMCLLLCAASIFVESKTLSAYMLMGGVASSRLGLWMFDLSVIQQMQDHIAESDRCIVGGVQSSIQSMLDLMTYVMGLLISDPQDFWKLTIISMVVVTLAAALYSLHVYRVRKHLLHFEKLLAVVQWFAGSS